MKVSREGVQGPYIQVGVGVEVTVQVAISTAL